MTGARRLYLLLFLAGLLVSLASAAFQPVPGYMDAEYYYAGALRLVAGQGGQEPYLWNYLNDPAALPAPSFAYWMPLTSLLAAAGLALLPAAGFWSARIASLLLAACIPPLAAALACRLYNRPDFARLAGALALVPGFYLAYWTTTDAFPIYMVAGTLFLLLAGQILAPVEAVRASIDIPLVDGRNHFTPQRPDFWGLRRLFLLGLLAGLLHLARADGLLWLGAACAVIVFSGLRKRLLPALAVVLFGYLLVTGPWLARNLVVWGSPLPPGGSRALWITEYEQTMIYPAALLTPAHWAQAGLAAHLQSRLSALATNLQTALAVQGSVLLFPFLLVGLWQARRRAEVRVGAGMWLLTFAVMTIAFPFAGPNGGFFHSGAALQPLLWAAAPAGIERVMQAYAGWRKMSSPAGMVRFMNGLVLAVCLLLSVLLYIQRVGGSAAEDPAGSRGWTASSDHYRAVEARLEVLGAQPGEPVLVNNPPGYWLASGRPAAVVPYGDEVTLLAAARRYGFRWLVLERSNPYQLADLYHGRVTPPGLEYLETLNGTRLYRVLPERGTVTDE